MSAELAAEKFTAYRYRGQNAELDRQALLKAKYCPRAAAESCTRKSTKTHVTFDL